MGIPEFTAESSLYLTSGHYRMARSGTSAIAESAIVPQAACYCSSAGQLLCLGGPPPSDCSCQSVGGKWKPVCSHFFYTTNIYSLSQEPGPDYTPQSV